MMATDDEGHKKASLQGVNLFFGDHKEREYLSTEIMEIPIVNKIECRLVSRPF